MGTFEGELFRGILSGGTFQKAHFRENYSEWALEEELFRTISRSFPLFPGNLCRRTFQNDIPKDLFKGSCLRSRKHIWITFFWHLPWYVFLSNGVVGKLFRENFGSGMFQEHLCRGTFHGEVCRGNFSKRTCPGEIVRGELFRRNFSRGAFQREPFQRELWSRHFSGGNFSEGAFQGKLFRVNFWGGTF